MDQFEQQLRDTIQRLALFDAGGERVVVAVSGGPDSLALLHLLYALRETLDLWLCVAVLDHGLREESAEEAAFVCRQAQALDLLCVRERRDVAMYAEQHNLSTEEAARDVRYEFLAQVAGAVDASAVAAGHTADDQAETVLMHLLRGAGIDGLTGMQPRGPLPVTVRDDPLPDSPPDLVRPLLFTSRTEILDYVERQELEPRFDRSNLDRTYFRNRLRHELLPALENYQPNIRAILARTAETLAVDWSYLQSQTDSVWEDLAECSEGAVQFSRSAFRIQHPAIQRRLVRRAVCRLRPLERDLSWEQVTEALRIARDGETGDRVTLPDGLFLIVGYEMLTIGEEPPAPAWPQLSPDDAIEVPASGEMKIADTWTLTMRTTMREDLPDDALVNANRWRAFLDADSITLPLRLRMRRTDDRFTPLGMDDSVDLADFLINQKVPAAVRDRLPLVVDADDRIVWVAGVRISNKARITNDTERVLRLTFLPTSSH